MTEKDALSMVDDHHDDGSATPGLLGPEAPLEWLEERICGPAGHLAAGTCRLLQLVGGFDARRGWRAGTCPRARRGWRGGARLPPAPPASTCGSARALGGLPVSSAEFAAGRMSYAKVRALTRIAITATEAELAQVVGPMTAAQCERFVAAHRKVSGAEELVSRAARRVSVQMAENGTVTVALGYLISPAPSCGGFAFTRPGGQPLPGNPELPHSDGDLTRWHDADITIDTIVPTGPADKLDLELAIWACFANARIAAERAAEGQREQHLAA
jgi:hypothetical protein